MPEAHGGLSMVEMRRAGVAPGDLLDFSVNVNPYGPSPAVMEALRSFDPAPYPDRDVLLLREALAAANGVAPDAVLPGNGTAELIWLAAQAFLKPGDVALIAGPAFGEYERAAQAMGAEVVHLRAEPPAFQLETAQIIEAIRLRRPKLVFLCNPNNPTGLRLDDASIREIASACGDDLLILDEAYRSFVTGSPFAPPPAPEVLVLRSMTKDFALAGLRLGYALGEPRRLEAMGALQPPWSVSGVAQAAGLAALSDLDHLTRTLALTREASVALRQGFVELGARVVPAETHFILIETGDGGEWRRRLMARGCLVRDCASFGLPRFVRAGTRLPEHNARLIEAWHELSV